MLLVTSLRLIKPNPAKGPYSSDWLGYFDLCGSYTIEVGELRGSSGSIVDVNGQPGLQFSVSLVAGSGGNGSSSGGGNSNLVVTLYRGSKPAYRSRGRPAPPLDRYAAQLEAAAARIARAVGFEQLLSNQRLIVQVYRCRVEYTGGNVVVHEPPVPYD